MVPVYYLPGRKTASPEVLAAEGLGYLLDGAGSGGFSAAEVPHSGPDGGSGCMFALPPAEGDAPPLAALAAAAKFRELGVGRVWFGVDPDSPPGPEDLLRVDAMGGHPVRLADGREWLIPAARRFDGATMLPEALGLSASGELEREVLPRWRDLWDDACELWDTDGELPYERLCAIVGRALSVNYRLGRAEVGPRRLGLLTSANIHLATAAVVDTPTIRRVMEWTERKKAEAGAAPSDVPGTPATSSSTSGAEASTPATPSPSPTCGGSKSSDSGE